MRQYDQEIWLTLITQVKWPEGMESLLLPACSPELDPVERWFEELRRALSNEVFETVEALARHLTAALGLLGRSGAFGPPDGV